MSTRLMPGIIAGGSFLAATAALGVLPGTQREAVASECGDQANYDNNSGFCCGYSLPNGCTGVSCNSSTGALWYHEPARYCTECGLGIDISECVMQGYTCNCGGGGGGS
jgi:hypothetical protein